MATRQEFCDGMNKLYEDHGMYVGTGNGERTLDVAGKFFEMEKNYGRRDKDGNPLWYTDTARDYEYLAKCYRKKWDMSQSRAGDCSGQIVGCLRRLGVIKDTDDYSAKGFQTLCTDVELISLKPGDLVFNKEKDSKGKGTATHVGVYISDGYTIESEGRDAGVTRHKVSEGNWVIGGRLPDSWFDDDIMVLTRILKYIPDNMMRGEDVRAVQQQLQLAGYTPGTADGVFGKKTKIAVQAFQLDNNLEADGIVGKNTATALGFKWEG